MLVVKCRAGERVLIGGDIAVTVDLIVDGDACLSVECPAQMPVLTSAEVRIGREAQNQGRPLGACRRRVVSSRTPPDLLIGDSVRVAVLPGSGRTVRLAIEAPSGVTIEREPGPGGPPARAAVGW